jgi:nuclear pore complex protein Nup62
MSLCAVPKEEKPLMDDDARERDRLYEKAERTAATLAALGEELRETIAGVNESAAAALGDASTPLGKIVRILNNQLRSLNSVDARTQELGRQLAKYSQAST